MAKLVSKSKPTDQILQKVTGRRHVDLKQVQGNQKRSTYSNQRAGV